MSVRTLDRNKTATWRLVPLVEEFYDYDWECSIKSYKCPNCRKTLYAKEEKCSDCGQALFWE